MKNEIIEQLLARADECFHSEHWGYCKIEDLTALITQCSFSSDLTSRSASVFRFEVFLNVVTQVLCSNCTESNGVILK